MKPAEVWLEGGAPLTVTWKRRPLQIAEIVDHWLEVGRWWEHEGECEFYLVETRLGLLLLGFDLMFRQWYAKRIQ
jgi:hypothetical protein